MIFIKQLKLDKYITLDLISETEKKITQKELKNMLTLSFNFNTLEVIEVVSRISRNPSGILLNGKDISDAKPSKIDTPSNIFFRKDQISNTELGTEFSTGSFNKLQDGTIVL